MTVLCIFVNVHSLKPLYFVDNLKQDIIYIYFNLRKNVNISNEQGWEIEEDTVFIQDENLIKRRGNKICLMQQKMLEEKALKRLMLILFFKGTILPMKKCIRGFLSVLKVSVGT